MKNRVPVPRDQRAPLPAFEPVPRKARRHDGWTPERQRAFIEALADTGSVSRAAAMVNMTPRCAYYLRRQPGAEGFRKAWEAALDFGVARMKDIAFERAVEGQLVPMLVGGRLIGWRRIYNDRLLMFCLRHYGEDKSGKRTTINYFSTRAGASAGEPGSGAGSEASTTTVRTVITGTGPGDGAAADLGSTAASIEDFAGVPLDDRARAELQAVLEQCAARHRAVSGTAEDESEPFVAALQPERDMLVYDPGYRHPRKVRRRPPPAHSIAAEPEELVEPIGALLPDTTGDFRSGRDEMPWTMLDDEEGMTAIEEAVESVRAAKSAERESAEAKAADGGSSLPSPRQGEAG